MGVRNVTDRGQPDRVARFVEDLASVLVDSGVPRMSARVFACLMVAEDGRLSAAELSARLKASPAAISGAVRYLVHVQLVSRGREPGSRRDYFVVEAEAFYRSTANREGLLTQWIERLDEGAAVLGHGTPAASRVEEIREFLLFLQKEMAGMLARWDAHRRSLGRPQP